jgi:hypothetical protein
VKKLAKTRGAKDNLVRKRIIWDMPGNQPGSGKPSKAQAVELRG